MSKGKWGRDPRTGLPWALLDRCAPDQLDSDGNIDVTGWPDTNVHDVRSFAAIAGFRDWRYFRDVVLVHPDSPFHHHEVPLHDPQTGSRLATLYFTHQNSADHGGTLWRYIRRTAARERMLSARSTAVSSYYSFR